ncbi:MAG: glutathione S-transferase [Verrucomicrobiales bacterium]|nr:glutathione S-transferase [Verrucomicrobiales bacterium]
MIELIQFPWSPFCIVQRRILEFSGIPFKTTNLPSVNDRSLIWKMTKERYYQVPVVRDGRTVIFEMDNDSQVVAKYLDQKFQLGLFPSEWRGLQNLLWNDIEGDVEGLTFRLNDIHFREFVRKADQLEFIRFKERKFGRHCIDHWREQQQLLLEQLAQKLMPFEQMLITRPFLLDQQPRFVDFDLYGMLGNFLYSGHYQLPTLHTRISEWFARMSKIKNSTLREKLRS